MLDIQVTVSGDQVVISGLEKLAVDMPQPLQRGLTKIIRGTHQEALNWLNGAGAKSSNVAPGGYPVPARTGNLKQHLDFLEPGQSKAGFSAGPLEAMEYDSAEYASVVHDGSGTSSKYGPRPFIDDGYMAFSGNTTEILESELETQIALEGLN